MIDLIVKSITKTLSDKFTNIPIINEDLQQNLPLPCFYVCVLNTSKKELLNDRFMLNVPLDIHYFASEKNKKSEINKISMELIKTLKILDLYKLNDSDVLEKVGSLKSFNISTEIVDNVLHFFIEFKPILNILKVDDDKMDKIDHTVGVDNNGS